MENRKTLLAVIRILISVLIVILIIFALKKIGTYAYNYGYDMGSSLQSEEGGSSSDR